MARGFTGARGGKIEVSASAKIMRDTLRKGGKITPETYKKMLQEKLNEAKARASSKEKQNFSMFGRSDSKKRSQSADKTMMLMAMMALEKEEKKLRKEVVIKVRRFINGRIDAKGKIFDQMGNIVARVNLKNGAMTTVYGQHFGIYKQNSTLVNNAIIAVINKNSPFLANQRKAIAAAATASSFWGGAAAAPSLDVWSRTPTDVWGNTALNGWGNPQVDAWGRTQTDAWGNQQVDMWGNQI